MQINQVMPIVGAEELKNLEASIDRAWLTEGPLTKSFLTEITSATNLTVANKLSLIFSYLSTDDSFTPMNVNSDLIFSLFLAFIASEKLENILGDNNAFSLIRSPLAKDVKILS